MWQLLTQFYIITAAVNFITSSFYTIFTKIKMMAAGILKGLAVTQLEQFKNNSAVASNVLACCKKNP